MSCLACRTRHAVLTPPQPATPRACLSFLCWSWWNAQNKTQVDFEFAHSICCSTNTNVKIIIDFFVFDVQQIIQSYFKALDDAHCLASRRRPVVVIVIVIVTTLAPLAAFAFALAFAATGTGTTATTVGEIGFDFDNLAQQSIEAGT
jgi:hypothetical protein